MESNTAKASRAHAHQGFDRILSTEEHPHLTERTQRCLRYN